MWEPIVFEYKCKRRVFLWNLAALGLVRASFIVLTFMLTIAFD